jgi:hypothetical protein
VADRVPLPHLGLLSPESIEDIRRRVLASREVVGGVLIVHTDDPHDAPAVTWTVRVETPDGFRDQVVSDWSVLGLIHAAAYFRARCEVLEMQLAHYRERGKAA